MIPQSSTSLSHTKSSISVSIEVNNFPVEITEKRPTGAGIKTAAISQGVPIQLTFQLILKRQGHASKVITDSEEVAVHDGMNFRAIPPDDNS